MAKRFLRVKLLVCHNGPCVWGRSLLTPPLRTSTQVPTLNGHNGKVALAVYGFTSSPFLCLNPSEKGLDVVTGLALTM